MAAMDVHPVPFETLVVQHEPQQQSQSPSPSPDETASFVSRSTANNSTRHTNTNTNRLSHKLSSDLAALDLVDTTTCGGGSMSICSSRSIMSTASKSSKSIRRRAVIQPLDDSDTTSIISESESNGNVPEVKKRHPNINNNSNSNSNKKEDPKVEIGPGAIVVLHEEQEEDVTCNIMPSETVASDDSPTSVSVALPSTITPPSSYLDDCNNCLVLNEHGGLIQQHQQDKLSSKHSSSSHQEVVSELKLTTSTTSHNALVLHSSSTNNNSSSTQHCHPLIAEHLHQKHTRGLEPTEVIRDKKSFYATHGNGGQYNNDDGQYYRYESNDPPGESPGDCPLAVCLDIVPHNSSHNDASKRGGDADGSTVCYSVISDNNSRMNNNNNGRRSKNIQWVDPKTIQEEGEIDYSVLRQYQELGLTMETTSTTTSTTTDYSPDQYGYGGYNTVDSHYYSSTNDNSYHRQQPNNNNSNNNNNSADDATHLLSNPRTRIATISSGYKKANFFVREDLDTRIYFHQLEDAVGYMAKRGYCKMRGGEEREWRDLLGRAHGVVKIGPKKEKQRYRKGKLVMILKKTITDHNDNINIKKKTKEDQLVVRQTKKKKKKQQQSSSSSNDNDSFASQSQATGRSISSHTTTTDNDNSFAAASEYTSPSQANTDRTSLGKSVRGPYKSYSEKFLAEQEEEKRRVMLAIVEGRPLPDDVIGYSNNNNNGNGAGRQLLLTDGNTGGSMASSGPTDPEADITSQHLSSSSCHSNDNEDHEDGGTRSGTSTMYTYGDTTTRASSTYGETATSTTVNSEDFKKSQPTMVSNGRRGVYGGGVRYFTPDNGQDDDDDEEGDDGSSGSDEEESGEEETMMSDDEDFEEEDTYDAYEDHIEVDKDDDEDDDEEERSGVIKHDEDEVNSMFSEESSSYDYNRTAGVDSVTSGCNDDDTVVSDVSKYSHNDSVKGMRKNKGRRSPPAMDGISDEDEDSR